jgi:hypothetical protein
MSTDPPPSAPASLHSVTHAIPEIVGTDINVNTAMKISQGLVTKEKKGHSVATSDHVTCFHGASMDTPSHSGGNTARGSPEALSSEGDEATDEPQPVHKLSVTIRTLLQQITLDPNTNRDSSTDSIGEQEDESDDSNNDIVEIVAPKKKGKPAVAPGHRKALTAVQDNDLESQSEDDENGEFNDLSYFYTPYIPSISFQSCFHSQWR